MRPAIVGGDAPEAPFPAYLRGTVEAGFGRGSKQLNWPHSEPANAHTH